MTQFDYGEYIKTINEKTEAQKFACQFIVLLNQRKVRIEGKTSITIPEELKGLQVENRLYYIDHAGMERHVLINKPGNEMIKEYGVTIPDWAEEALIAHYNKKTKDFKDLRYYHQKAHEYHEQSKK